MSRPDSQHPMLVPPSLLAFAVLGLVPLASVAGEPDTDADTDGDGLSDVHELRKYGTDPRRADSDGDGTPDGHWLERREYAYTVRSVVQVMKPVTLAFLDDDFQDVRRLDEAPDRVELEVIHYPLATPYDGTEGATTRVFAEGRLPPELDPWLRPGPTSDADPELRAALLAALAADGLHLAELTDRALVERVAGWLLERAEVQDGFTTFITAFDEQGRASVPAALAAHAERRAHAAGWEAAGGWQRELSAKGMFEHRVRGTCTSTAIYLSGCLRALGVPTRTVLCIPAIDASDPEEWRLLEVGIEHRRVRRTIESALSGGRDAWTSHTFNEVWLPVDGVAGDGELAGRWVRLDGARLGQGILDERALGLMTHVATFRDWSEARMHETVGRRQALGHRADVFGHANPYSTISLRDEVGVHAELELPLGPERLRIERLLWCDDEELPVKIRRWHVERRRFGFMAVIRVASFDRLRAFLEDADTRLSLEAEGHPPLGVRLDAGCWWYDDGLARVSVPFGEAARRDLVRGVPYRVRAANDAEHARWDVDLVVRRE